MLKTGAERQGIQKDDPNINGKIKTKQILKMSKIMFEVTFVQIKHEIKVISLNLLEFWLEILNSEYNLC